MFIFPTFTQNVTRDQDGSSDQAITFQTSEGMSVSADVGISYHIERDKIDTVFQKYRKGIDEITDTFLRNIVRDSLNTRASRLTAETVYGSGKEDLIRAAQTDTANMVAPIGIIVEKLYWASPIRMPETMVASLNLKIEAQQRAIQRQNEVAEAKAEAQKETEKARGQAEQITLRAEAQAKANKILAESLTSELVQYKALEIWDGKLPVYATGPVPFVNITPDQ